MALSNAWPAFAPKARIAFLRWMPATATAMGVDVPATLRSASAVAALERGVLGREGR